MGWAGFGYDSRKGVGACDRGPSGLGDAKEGRDGLFPALREKRLKAEFGYDDGKGVGECDRGPSWLDDAKEGRDGLFPALREKRAGLD